MTREPWADTASNENNGQATPDVEVILAPVPVGKLLVVEHVSGRLAVRDGEVVEFLQVAAQGENAVVFLPVQFVSGVSQFTPAQGVGRWHQFGSPARLYVRGGNALVATGGSDATFSLFVSAIGHLVDA